MRERGEGKRATITGIVVAHDWDSDGNVTAVALSTAFEDEYVIRGGSVGAELVRLVGSKVVATGIVSSDTDWTNTIAVEKYEVLGYDGEEEDEDIEEYEEEEEEEEAFEDQEELEYLGEQW
jgi:hypothetical protein